MTAPGVDHSKFRKHHQHNLDGGAILTDANIQTAASLRITNLVAGSCRATGAVADISDSIFHHNLGLIARMDFGYCWWGRLSVIIQT
jgi:hypothetical protein